MSARPRGLLRMNGGIMLTAAVVLLVSVAVFAYLYAPAFVSAFHAKWQQQGVPSGSSLKAEESAIKEVLIEYVHSMLIDGPKTQHQLFTDRFLDASDADETILPKVYSVQIGQPVISFSRSDVARVRFPQIVRMQAGIRLSQERFLFKRTAGGRWKIDQRASQPVMMSSSNAVIEKNAFLYVKSEHEKTGDRRDIENLLALWTEVRTRPDVEDVAKVYSKDIWEKRGTTKEKWLKNLKDPEKISVSNVNVVYPHQLGAEVTLLERIDESNKQTHSDVRMTLELSDEGWLITEEQSRALSEEIIRPIRIEPKPVSVPVSEAATSSNLEPSHQKNAAAPVSVESKSAQNAAANGVPSESNQDIVPNQDIVKVAAPDTDDTSTIKTLVYDWAKAWSKKNVQAYLGFYSQRFVPVSGMSVEQWRKHRATRLAKPSFIDVKVRELQVKQQGENQAKVSFIQFYRSDTYQDKALKTLTLARESGEWKIAGEYSTTL